MKEVKKMSKRFLEIKEELPCIEEVIKLGFGSVHPTTLWTIDFSKGKLEDCILEDTGQMEKGINRPFSFVKYFCITERGGIIPLRYRDISKLDEKCSNNREQIMSIVEKINNDIFINKIIRCESSTNDDTFGAEAANLCLTVYAYA